MAAAPCSDHLTKIFCIVDHRAAGRWPDETVLLISHGGPSAALYRYTQRAAHGVQTSSRPGGYKSCRYCGLYALRQGRDGRWETLLEAEDSHLSEVAGASADGISSVAEQSGGRVTAV